MAANQEELLAYLSHPLPPIPHDPEVRSGQNTSHPNYSPNTINQIGHWAAFTYQDIINSWGNHLSGPGCALIDYEPPFGSPCQPIRSEDQFKSKVAFYIDPRIRRAIRSGNFHIDGNNQGLAQRGMSTVEFLHGDGAATIDNFRPDYAIAITVNLPVTQKVNRCPGVAKVVWKWQYAWINAQNPTKRVEYLKVLAQVNLYMKQHHTRYGYVFTDAEFVPIRRMNNDGHLKLGPPIPWTSSNIVGPGEPGYNQNHVTYRGVLTPLLALWYLAMLAANDQGYQMP